MTKKSASKQEYYVEKIIDSRYNNKKLEYHVKWIGIKTITFLCLD